MSVPTATILEGEIPRPRSLPDQGVLSFQEPQPSTTQLARLVTKLDSTALST